MASLTNFWRRRLAERLKAEEHNKVVAKAIKLSGGSAAELARKMGITGPHLSRMLFCQREVTAEMAIAFEKALHGKIKRSDFRPDLFL
jgi:DNA-binding transcriptional regulator YdaS (Cro superfamily)